MLVALVVEQHPYRDGRVSDFGLPMAVENLLPTAVADFEQLFLTHIYHLRCVVYSIGVYYTYNLTHGGATSGVSVPRIE